MKKKTSPRKMSLYANLSHSRKTKKDQKARKKAEYLATLPKHPVKRLIYRMHPKRVFGYWFSKKGAFMALKILGVFILLGVLTVVGLFAYYRRDLDSIRPSELAKRVQTTVTRYYDRNGTLLYEDKGEGNYTLTVKSDQISKYMKQATVAIEDKDFYKHHGISPTGILRSAINNAQGEATQGGSTLTQQLVKQVFFADEAQERGLGGIPRKIKEIILALEVERMYDKDQILTLYLNESPYGGRRNGVESGARTYFGKSAKNLTLAEAAMLASIPNEPGVYDPYNNYGHKALLARQHKVLDSMVSMRYITKAQADEAKDVDIIAEIKPQENDTANMKAPWFVIEVRHQLEKELGKATVGRGGLTVQTTVDLKAQEVAQQAVAAGAEIAPAYGADNIALSSIDVKTGQVIAMVGSIDWNKPGYGQQNATTSLLEPGSSIKPILDYVPLFMQREGVNYAPGSILSDENINSLYCAGYQGGSCSLENDTRQTFGAIPIRMSLAGSLNRPAVKALHIVGIDNALKIARDLGDQSYCKGNTDAGLSMGIGGGCTVRQIEHTNAYASLARGGSYLPLSYILKVTNSEGQVLKKWTPPKPKQVVDPQVAYMISDILHDANARRFIFGSMSSQLGFYIPGVWTAAKTGTTDNGHGYAKDSWIMNYSPAVATGIWVGNHDGSHLISDSHNVVMRVNSVYMEGVHKNVYGPEGRWREGDEIAKPNGIKTLSINGRTDIYPSWYDKNAGITNAKLTFDKVSKKLATDCTPDSAKTEIGVTKTTDPITKRSVFIAPDGYDATKEDDTHKCDDVKPMIKGISTEKSGNQVKITVNVTQGTHQLSSIKISVGSKVVADSPINGTGSYSVTVPISSKQTISATVEDNATYTGTSSTSYSPAKSSD